MRNFQILKTVVGFVARLRQPIEFDAVDDEPVDILFLLLAPEGAGTAHLKALARVSRLLRNGRIREGLRAARDAQAIYGVLAGSANELQEAAAASH